jgi:Fur family transcriptional regulator, stress-responsive regulator
MGATDADRLRAAGLRVTSARLAILDVVRAHNHPGAEEITEAVRERIGHVSLQGVYEALGALSLAGLIRRIEPAGSPARYEGRVGDNHHHIVCRNCGTVADVDCAVGTAPCLEPAVQAGFLVDEAEVTFWGTCAQCRAAAGQLSTGQLSSGQLSTGQAIAGQAIAGRPSTGHVTSQPAVAEPAVTEQELSGNAFIRQSSPGKQTPAARQPARRLHRHRGPWVTGRSRHEEDSA